MSKKFLQGAGIVVPLLILVPFGVSQFRRGDVQELAASLGLQPVWSWPLPRTSARDRLLTAQVLDSDLLVVQMESGSLYALDAQTGGVKWGTRVGKPFAVYQKPASASRRMVIVPVNLSLLAYERQSGVRVWQLELRDVPLTTPACDDWQLAVSEGTTRLRCWLLPDIDRLLTTRGIAGAAPETTKRSIFESGVSSYEIRRQSLREPERVWDFDDPIAYTVPPVCVSQLFTVSINREGKLRVISSHQRQIVSEWKLPAGASAPMTFRLIERPGEKVVNWEPWLVMPCQDRSVYAFLVQQGKLAAVWQRVLGDSANAAAVLLNTDLFVSTNERGLFCIERDTGQIRWRQPEAVRFTAASPGLVIAESRQGRVLALDRKNGQILSAAPFPSGWRFFENSFTDRVYLFDGADQLHCLRDRSPDCAMVRVYHRLLYVPPAESEKKPMEQAGAEKPEKPGNGAGKMP